MVNIEAGGIDRTAVVGLGKSGCGIYSAIVHKGDRSSVELHVLEVAAMILTSTLPRGCPKAATARYHHASHCQKKPHPAKP